MKNITKFKYVFFVLLINCLFIMPVVAENIDLSADDGLIWDRVNMTITMNKNATAKTPSYELRADEIKAYHRQNKKIYKIIGAGNVKITSKTLTITSDKLLYDIDNEKIDLKSSDSVPVTMTGNMGQITSTKTITYFRNKKYAIAENIIINHAKRIMSADSANIKFTDKNARDIEKITATGNIKIIDEKEELYGDNAEYNPTTGYATIFGNVHFKKGDDANLSGGLIEYNMNTGIAKILPNSKGGKINGTFTTKTSTTEVFKLRPKNNTTDTDE